MNSKITLIVEVVRINQDVATLRFKAQSGKNIEVICDDVSCLEGDTVSLRGVEIALSENNSGQKNKMKSNDRDKIIKSIDILLTDITEYRDHCYCMESYEVVDLLDRTIKTIEILNKMIGGN